MDQHNRTIVKDIARLIKTNKISQKDLNALDKDLRAEAISYASTMEDEESAPLSIRKHPITKDEMKDTKTETKIRPTPLPPTPQVTPPSQPKPIPPPVVPSPQPKPIQPPPPPPPLVQHMKDDQGDLESKMKDLEVQRVSLEKDLQGLMSEKNGLLHTIESIKHDEMQVEEEERRIRRELQESMPLEDKKKLEEQRWGLEDKRQAFEKSRWETRKSEDSLGEKILIKRKELTEITSKEKEIENDVRLLNLKKEAEKAKQELNGYEEEHGKIVERKKKYEADWSSISAAVLILKDKIEDNKKILKDANKEFEGIEKKEGATDDEKERHKLEEQRWESDKKLRDAEKEVWSLEDELNKKTEEQKDLENTFASIQTEEEEILDKIQHAKTIIQKADHKI